MQDPNHSARKKATAALVKRLQARFKKEFPKRKIEVRDDSIRIPWYPGKSGFQQVSVSVECGTQGDYYARQRARAPDRVRLSSGYGGNLTGTYKLDKHGALPDAKLDKIVARVREHVGDRVRQRDQERQHEEVKAATLRMASEALLTAGFKLVAEHSRDVTARFVPAGRDTDTARELLVELLVEASDGQVKISVGFSRENHWCSPSTVVEYANELVRHARAIYDLDRKGDA